MKNKIVHIYAGTSGAAGLYMHEIYEALKDNFEQKCVVNFYYPFEYGERYFYKLTELSGVNILMRFKYLRFALRYLELTLGLIRATLLIVNFKPAVINYNLTSQNYVELLFLRFIKKITRVKIILTLHDVIPFSSTNISLNNPLKMRQLFISIADNILVHNSNSTSDLLSNFAVDKSIIVQHDFPIMDANFLFPFDNLLNENKLTKPYTFLFVGHGRPEKGLDLLINAWINNFIFDDCVSLIIAGNITLTDENLLKISNLSNVNIVPRFLSDYEYFSLIKNSDCLVMPYKFGTNSGIPSTALSLGTDVICSSIKMFINNALINVDSIFETENVDSLVDNMIYKIKTNINIKNDFSELLKNYRIKFSISINSAYIKMSI